MSNSDIKGWKFVRRVKFPGFNILLHTKSEQKVIGNSFCAPIIFKKSFKNLFFNKKYTFTICVWRVWIVIGYILFEKQTYNGLLKVIGI